jgi:predicted Zn-dependent protease
LLGCATNPVTGGKNFVLMSEQEEIALGRQYHPQIVGQHGVYPDEELQQYVNRVGQQLAKASHRPHLEYHFTVLDDDIVNAFALPGGYIYITRGMLAHLNSEAELAAVLGHEIGHVTDRHAVRQHSQSQLLGVLGSVAGAATGVAGSTTANLFGGALLKGYGRNHELKADELGAEYLARTDYPPEAMIEVIEVLKNRERFEIDRARKEGREPKVYHGFLASHPDNDKRLREVVEKAKELGEGNPDRVNREGFLLRIDGMTWGQGGQSGVVRENEYYNARLAIKFSMPENWQIESQAGKILAVAPGQAAALQVSVMPLAAQLRPRDFLIRRLQVTGLREGRDISVGGMEGFLAIAADSQSPYGKRLVRYAVIYDRASGQAYVFSGAEKRNSVDDIAADRDFIPAIFSLDKLAPGDYDLAQPAVVKVVTPSAGTDIETLAAQSPLGPYAAEQLRLLNDLYPSGQPKSGEAIKVVE